MPHGGAVPGALPSPRHWQGPNLPQCKDRCPVTLRPSSESLPLSFWASRSGKDLAASGEDSWNSVCVLMTTWRERTATPQAGRADPWPTWPCRPHWLVQGCGGQPWPAAKAPQNPPRRSWLTRVSPALHRLQGGQGPDGLSSAGLSQSLGKKSRLSPGRHRSASLLPPAMQLTPHLCSGTGCSGPSPAPGTMAAAG